MICKILKNNTVEIKGDFTSKKESIALLDRIRKYKDTNTIVITTTLSLKHFQKNLGFHCADKVGMRHLIAEKMIEDDDDLMYEFMGRVLLDNALPQDYFIKSIEDNKVYEIKSAK